MAIVEHHSLHACNTFGLPASARYFCRAQSLQEVRDALAFARAHELPVLVLGGGSNLLLREDFPGLVLALAVTGMSLQDREGESVRVRAACGESWHGFVTHCLAAGWHGLENLALIPGSVGAAPLQNIGAYGVEVGEFITQVEVLDIATGECAWLSREACQFGYRDSVFKRALKGQKIIVSVEFLLHTTAKPVLSYAGLAQALPTATPSAQEVFDAVCAIRRQKLPDPAVLGNAGSFFKNPVIARDHYQRLLTQWPGLPQFAIDGDEAHVKVPAAWLIEQAGWKGQSRGGAAVYPQQALVIVNQGGATADDIVTLATDIMQDITQRFAIALEPEVQWVPPFVPDRGSASTPSRA